MEALIHKVECFGDLVVTSYLEEEGKSSTNVYQVRQKYNLRKIIFSYYCDDDDIHMTMYDFVGNSFLIYHLQRGYYQEIELSTGVKRPLRRLPTNCRWVVNLFDNLAVIQRGEYLEVWDWKNNSICHVLYDDHDKKQYAPILEFTTGKWLMTSSNNHNSEPAIKVYRCK
ncbi:uncharacterized protein LOC120350153 [Nilaparvata lugens]|nr:uncharacterized protein LOC120350153 [Nilaparvata lugens]